VTDWIFLSKHKQDQYVNAFAQGSGGVIVNTSDFDYCASGRPIVLRGILKHKIMQRCWQDGRDFYYMDSGYLGNLPGPRNPQGWKTWHRIVPNDLQHQDIIDRPADRWQRLGIQPQPRRYGRRIVLACPDQKPCRFYGIDQATWIRNTVNQLQSLTDRPVLIRERASSRQQRTQQDPLNCMLQDDVHVLVTFNSNAAVESILAGVPAIVLAPTHAASPVAGTCLEQVESPPWPDTDKLYAWLCHLSYGQFHNTELADGTAYRILNEN
jgi:hypothetical protein